MAIRVSLNHRTKYAYDRPICLFPQIVRLRPAPHCRSPIEAYSLRIEPADHFINWQQDPFGNFLARLVFPEKTKEFQVEVDLVAELPVINPFDFFLDTDAKEFPFNYDPLLAEELRPYLEIRERGPKLMQFMQSIDRRKRGTVDFLVDLNRLVCDRVNYLIRMEPGVQSCEETLTKNSGSCRDSAWLEVQMLRHLGLASRFVSGYIVQLTPDVKSLDGPSGPTNDFCDLHAWTEVYIPGAGWIGLDATSGLMAGEGHIPLACTPDPTSAAPITGSLEECETDFEFAMQISRIDEKPRVTKPFTEEAWQRIESLGHKVDEELSRCDVRLTMGGEPTFVSIDDMDGEEWNTGALGENKRRLARGLMQRMKEKLAPQGLLHVGQGKWYPGEELPRWSLSAYWRKDGQPIWLDEKLTADDRQSGSRSLPDAELFIRTLAKHLGVDPNYVVPGYEDVFYYLWKERTYPANIDPHKSNLKDPLERKRLATLLDKGLDKVTGYALPLRWQDHPQSGWYSGTWEFKTGRMYLLPGDSPMGLRLPLESLLYELPGQRYFEPERCTMESWPPLGPHGATRRTKPTATGSAGFGEGIPGEGLGGEGFASGEGGTLGEGALAAGLHHPDPHGEIARRYSTFRASADGNGHPGIYEQQLDSAAETAQYPDWLVRTALVVEPRNGHIHVFLPPIAFLEHYLELIHCVEKTAAELQIPCIIEGYPPPHDPRIQLLKITPDPGVIEVNLPPSDDWIGLRALTEMLYEEARHSRLGTEKFMLDGRHTGTGGGNHVTLGGTTPADSPMLRRPDVLRSMLTYWQHHPSLSYMFSGLFIGPTSQAPRIDEARHESLYELEIAFEQMEQQSPCFPWMVDRALRNILTDITGNTHRAEFCIDKLFSPDGYHGRQGIVELRFLEMPPHERMSLLQQLLIRSLVARFWNEPYKQKLVRWGTGLHDKHMLPHFLWQDLHDVVCDLKERGYDFEHDWFTSAFEFRFPLYGKIQAREIGIELRMAMEPWHVLGEEATAGGTSRYVDSSVERLQIKVTGLTDSRHVIACNGRRVPLVPTGTHGEYVAGIRYRAWQPPSAMHPSIGVHSPLVFDIIDTWNERSVGGCTYHVMHPNGVNYAMFPVNSYEAESRRIARFWSFGHTPGRLAPPVEERNKEYPCTLDLRRGVTC